MKKPPLSNLAAFSFSLLCRARHFAGIINKITFTKLTVNRPTMSKLLALLSGIACLVWITAWSWLLAGEKSESHPITVLPKVSITISDGEFHYTGNNVFHFNLSDAIPFIGKEDTALFQAVSSHLNRHPEKDLQLTGFYMPKERNNTHFVNLGVARGEAVKVMLKAAGARDSRIHVKGEEANNLIQVDGKIYTAVNFTFNENGPPAANVESPAEESLYEPRPKPKDIVVLRYPKKKFNLYDVGGRIVQILDSLRNHVQQQPSVKLVITGYSEITEEASTSFNLAETRAMAVRRYLVDTGLSGSQVVVRFESGMDGAASNCKVELHVDR